ncbi:GHMP family kinase ATP-binding protein [Chengkuizengella axinellae]|uniref:Kinase n=1 Tax=Chengkuizengella axinellae TaxID=3064388 RepID=A0ABT9IZR9_9BACL|nr:kinase [Chengkuizengella sp. 2205SS18-9]MDP5274861.1 kinase [Chengkuizengella sp. 2205SS18-9]
MLITKTQIKTVRIGVGKSFGTFGELLQGALPGQVDFLVTFPIKCYSFAKFVSDPELNVITVFPASKRKSQRLVKMILDYYHLPLGGRLELESNIPVGKGLASSSADLVATARAISNCFNLNLSNNLLQQFLMKLEPTDGVMYQGICSFKHKKVELIEFYRSSLPLTVVGIDEGGIVDTIQFNKLPKKYNIHKQLEYEQLLSNMKIALKHRDLKTIGRIATRSTVLNQEIRPKKYLNECLEISNKFGGLGIITSHSGTCIGILLDSTDKLFNNKVNKISKSLQNLTDEVMIYHSWQEKEEVPWHDF